ncbi:16403_t:CDS:2, partial [Dentiscutata heterogama]
NDFDQHQWDLAKIYEKYNVYKLYYYKSKLACLINNFKRNQKQKNKGKESASKFILQKKYKNQTLNEKNKDSISTLTMVSIAQEQNNFIE